MKEQGGEGAGDAMDGLGDLEKLQEMMASAMQDPETLKAMEAMQENIMGAMEQMSKLSPEEMQAQMAEAMKMMTDGSMVDNIVEKKDEVLASLEQTGLVSAEELAKYKADPEYFESQMRSAFDQMSGIFNDPEILQSATQAMAGMQEAMDNPIAKELGEILVAAEIDDVKVEELRLKILQNPEALANSAVYGPMFATPEFQEQLKDSKKWKEGVTEARTMMQGGSELLGTGDKMGVGAGVGEL